MLAIRGWIHMESERVRDIDEYLAGLTRAAVSWPMTMGWGSTA